MLRINFELIPIKIRFLKKFKLLKKLAKYSIVFECDVMSSLDLAPYHYT